MNHHKNYLYTKRNTLLSLSLLLFSSFSLELFIRSFTGSGELFVGYEGERLTKEEFFPNLPMKKRMEITPITPAV